MKELYNLIRDIPDFPKKGIIFKDITPLLKDEKAFEKVIKILADNIPDSTKKIAAIESRGFIFAGALAFLLKKGFIPIRKTGKLPYKTINYTYQLEYGTDTIEIHSDAIEKGEKVVIIDDLLATGGTAYAAAKLVEKCGGVVEKIVFLIELSSLNGEEKLKDYQIFSLLKL
jgi:adenine phosphoribosyltransferase